MKNNYLQLKWQQIRSRINLWQAKRSEEKLRKFDRKNAMFIGILQKRYGFSKLKAIHELNKHYTDIILT